MRAQLEKVTRRARVKVGPYATSDKDGSNGLFHFRRDGGLILQAIASSGHEAAGLGLEPWEHVSVLARIRGREQTPTWGQMCWVKARFWEPEEAVVQYHPPASEAVNLHPHALHLWRPILRQLPMPPRLYV